MRGTGSIDGLLYGAAKLKQVTKEPFVEETPDGVQITRLGPRGEVHSFDDNPAVQVPEGVVWWSGNGVAFQGPARIWFHHGRVDRPVGPAVVYRGRRRQYFKADKLHRVGGPAAYGYRGTREWFLEGVCHRTDGPAITDMYGNEFWHLDGEFLGSTGPDGSPPAEFLNKLKESYPAAYERLGN